MNFLCIDFINSEWYKTHDLFKEPFNDNIWISEFTLKWDLTLDESSDEKQIDTLLKLRNLLKEMIYDLCENQLANIRDLESLNKYMEPFKFKKSIILINNRYTVTNVPVENTGNWTIYKIISSFFELVTEHDLDRINICQNPDCCWVFYDESKNRTRKWCANTCASLMKVRKYRDKQKIICKNKLE